MQYALMFQETHGSKKLQAYSIVLRTIFFKDNPCWRMKNFWTYLYIFGGLEVNLHIWGISSYMFRSYFLHWVLIDVKLTLQHRKIKN